MPQYYQLLFLKIITFTYSAAVQKKNFYSEKGEGNFLRPPKLRSNGYEMPRNKSSNCMALPKKS